ncbi:MAG: DUF393 domain-containing protein [Fimbriimonadaceae bacterium]|nr:DUF393 domain-containing protein [Fimbriimonadaceae bacterium]
MTWKLFYDGGCNLCHVSRLRVEKWAERAKQPMVVEVLQGDEALQKGYSEHMIVEADRVYQGWEAWFLLLTITPWYLRWMSWLAKFPLTRPFMRWTYKQVVKYRYKWFGTRECQIPQKKA